MEPLFVLFWSTIAFQAGFISAYALLGWTRGIAVAALTSFVVVGLVLPLPGGIAVGLAYLATLCAVGLKAGPNTMLAMAIGTTALAVTALANASHTPEGFAAMVALFGALGLSWGADLWRTNRDLPYWV